MPMQKDTLTLYAEDSKQFTALLGVCADLSRSIERSYQEIVTLRIEQQEHIKQSEEKFALINKHHDEYTKKTDEEFRLIHKRMLEDQLKRDKEFELFCAYQRKADEEFKRMDENQEAIYEILSDTADSVSDHMLSQKIRQRSAKLRKALSSQAAQ